MSLSIQKTPQMTSVRAIVLAFCLGACSPSEELGLERSIGAPRRIESKGAQPRLFAASAERFGLSTPGAVSAGTFQYTTPPVWNEVAPTEMRAVNFQIGEGTATQCYVTVLGGDGGGPLANVNRWCGQIKIAPWTQKELDAAPQIEMFGADAVIVDLYDAGGEHAVLGALARLESRALFVKLTGTRADTLAQRGAFETFCKSLSRKP